MKKYIYSVLIALIAISCSQSDDFNNSYVDISPTNIPQTLYAEIPDVESRAIEQFVDQPMSWDKTASNESRTVAVHDTKNTSEYYQYWSVGDEISLFLTTHNLKYGLINTTEPDRGTFTLQSDAIASSELLGDYYYSVYPYKEDTKISQEGVVTFTFPEIQYYNVDSYANGINGMIAREPKNQTDGLLEFQNFCSYLQINLAHPEIEQVATSNVVKKISLMTNNENVKISGVGKISYAYDKDNRLAPVVNMVNSDLSRRRITLDCSKNEKGGVEISKDIEKPTTFWFVLPGGIEFTGGFTITVMFADGTNFRKVTDKDIRIVRNHIKPMKSFSTINNVPEGSLRYKLEDPNTGPYEIGTEFYDGTTKLDIISHRLDPNTGEYVVNFNGTLNRIGAENFEKTSPKIEYIKINNNAPIDIDEDAFYNCDVESIDIFNDVKNIYSSSFKSSKVKNLNIYGDVENIASYVMTTTYGIENLNIYGSVYNLSNNAFSGTQIYSVFIENEITTIGSQAFYGCENLQSVYLPGLKNIEKEAFCECTALKDIKLDKIENIGKSAFFGCISLEYVELSSHCQYIDNKAFCKCHSLSTVYCYATVPPTLGKDAFNTKTETQNPHTIIYIPKGTKEIYANPTTYWTNYADILSEM